MGCMAGEGGFSVTACCCCNNTITPFSSSGLWVNCVKNRGLHKQRTQMQIYVQTHNLFFCPLHLLHADWDIDQPSLPFKSHKTINLTSSDHPILLGSPETKPIKPSLDFTSRTLTETVPAKETPTHPFVVSRWMTFYSSIVSWLRRLCNED